LVILGLTRYYNIEWDSATNQARRSTETVTPESEQEMLKRFAAQHNLHHRLVVQSDESKTADYYGAATMPHVVVIDQQGKVRLIRAGVIARRMGLTPRLLLDYFDCWSINRRIRPATYWQR
jgi:hypothetical protein